MDKIPKIPLVSGGRETLDKNAPEDCKGGRVLKQVSKEGEWVGESPGSEILNRLSDKDSSKGDNWVNTLRWGSDHVDIGENILEGGASAKILSLEYTWCI